MSGKEGWLKSQQPLSPGDSLKSPSWYWLQQHRDKVRRHPRWQASFGKPTGETAKHKGCPLVRGVTYCNRITHYPTLGCSLGRTRAGSWLTGRLNVLLLRQLSVLRQALQGDSPRQKANNHGCREGGRCAELLCLLSACCLLMSALQKKKRAGQTPRSRNLKCACYHALDLRAAHPSLSEHLVALLSYALESGTDAHRGGPLPYKGKVRRNASARCYTSHSCISCQVPS